MITAKTCTLVEDYEYICRKDAAIDSGIEDFEKKWGEYLEGMSPAPIKPNSSPTIFTLGHLKGRAKAIFEREARTFSVSDQDFINLGTSYAAFRMAVRDVAPFEDKEGKQVELKFDTIEGVRMLTAESMGKFGDAEIREVGQRVIIRSYLSKK